MGGVPLFVGAGHVYVPEMQIKLRMGGKVHEQPLLLSSVDVTQLMAQQ